MTKLEQVARALRDELGSNWSLVTDKGWMNAARAAVEALHQPTEAMIGEMREAISEELSTDAVWMIGVDAILSEKPE